MKALGGFTKAETLEALDACNEFECGRCPYQKYDSDEYKLRCIHMLITNLHEIMFKEVID